MNFFQKYWFDFFRKRNRRMKFFYFLKSYAISKIANLLSYTTEQIRFFFLVRHMKILFILLFKDIDIRIQFFYLIFRNQNVFKTYLKYRTFHLRNFEKNNSSVVDIWQWSQMKAVHTLHVILNNLILKIAKRKKWHRFAFFFTEKSF
jgi:hypothetical protein